MSRKSMIMEEALTKLNMYNHVHVQDIVLAGVIGWGNRSTHIIISRDTANSNKSIQHISQFGTLSAILAELNQIEHNSIGDKNGGMDRNSQEQFNLYISII